MRSLILIAAVLGFVLIASMAALQYFATQALTPGPTIYNPLFAATDTGVHDTYYIVASLQHWYGVAQFSMAHIVLAVVCAGIAPVTRWRLGAGWTFLAGVFALNAIEMARAVATMQRTLPRRQIDYEQEFEAIMALDRSLAALLPVAFGLLLIGWALLALAMIRR
jgi:hypothetical protein